MQPEFQLNSDDNLLKLVAGKQNTLNQRHIVFITCKYCFIVFKLKTQRPEFTLADFIQKNIFSASLHASINFNCCTGISNAFKPVQVIRKNIQVLFCLVFLWPSAATGFIFCRSKQDPLG